MASATHTGWKRDLANGRLAAEYLGTEVFDFDANDINVSQAATFASTVGVTGAITATGGLTVPEAGGNITAKGLTISDGGTVTQATSATTGVTLNTTTGQITTVTQNIAAGGEVTFTVTNSVVAATSVVVCSIASGSVGGTSIAAVSAIAAGSFDITITNLHASTAETGTLVINFAVFGGSAT